MKTYIKCKLIMLPTKKISTFQLVSEDNQLYKSPNDNENPNDLIDNLGVNQFIYIISNEKVKEGDWFLQENTILRTCFDLEWEGYYKIIASNDPFITANSVLALNTCRNLLPELSKLFIDYYIIEYNKGNIIDKVEVEYEVIRKGVASGQDCIFGYICSDTITEEILVINPDNTISIKI